MVLVLAFVSFSLVVSTGGVGGQSVEDDHGNTFDTATTLSLGASEEGRIDPINDIDMFKLDLSGESEPTTVRIYTTGDLDSVGRLFDSDGSFLASNDDYDGYNFQIVETLPSGIYYVSVQSYFNSEIRDYALHAEEVPPDDHANSTDGATPINLGSSVTGSIDPGYDVDMFKLDLSDASEPTPVWLYTSGNLYTAGQLYDSEGSALQSNQFYDGRNFQIVETLASGIYYVSVESSYSSTVGDYTLHAEEAPPDDHANTTDGATPIALGSSVTGRIFPGLDVDMFKLDLSGASEPTNVRLYTTGYLATLGQLYDSDGSTLSSNAYHRDGNFQIVETLPSGIYYVSVEGYYYSRIGDYTLHAEEVPPDDHANTTDGATPITLGSSVTGSIDPDFDVDMFKLDLSGESEPINVRLYTSGNLNTVGRLYDNDGSLLQYNDYYYGQNFQIVETLPSGIYYVSVETRSYYSSVGDYTLLAEEVPPDDHANRTDGATPLTFGSSVTGSIDPDFDRDFFKVDLSDASESTDVSIYTTGDLNTVGVLYDSNDGQLAYNDNTYTGDSYNQNFNLRATLPSGIYYVEVTSYGLVTGDYTLHAEVVPDQGDTIETATDLSLDSPTLGTIDTSEDADYFKFDFTELKNLIITVSTLGYSRLDVTALDSEGNEVSLNVFPLDYSYGFLIQDDVGPGASYLKLTAPESYGSNPVHYTIQALEDVAYTEFIEGCEAETRSLNNEDISDPLYACQWHQNSLHEGDINIESVWKEDIKGEGVNVAVVDNGMYYAHEDLKDNVDTSLNHDYTGNGDIYRPYEHHGTRVSGLIAARDNDVGVRGVAPRATIYGYNFLAYTSDFNAADAMARNRVVTAVSSNSWERRSFFSYLAPIPTILELAIDAGIAEGYHGKGTFYAFAAGNGHLGGDNSNFSELTNYYGVTAVCAVNDHDVRSDFSEMGANLWVCAPSNDSSDEHRGILTTENSDRYYEEFGGTSAATPIVAGVAALLRGVDPDLTWRDLKLILAASARKNDIENSGWEYGASKYGMAPDTEFYHFNHEYGFGVVDAAAAVDLAKEWSIVPQLQSSTVESDELNLEIPDPPDSGDPTAVTTALTLETTVDFIEFVEVNLDFQQGDLRDWDVELVSPSGAVSTLVPHLDPYDYYASADSSDVGPSHFYYYPTDYEFRFGSARHLGEDADGEWQLRITDHDTYNTGTLESWSLTVYGHERTPGPPLVDWVTPGADSLTVGWTAPSQTGGLSFTGYDVRHIQTDADEAVESNWTVLEDAWNASTGGDLEYTVAGLSDGVQYDLQVRAVNTAGKGFWSRTITATATQSLCSTDGAVADAANHPGLVSDCEALLAGRDTLAGSGALNWSADTPITEWDGIPSLESQRVTRLYLQSKQLSGSVPPEFGAVTNLQWLYLYGNDLSSEIPAELGRLTRLQRLFLYDNGLSGPIPGELGSIYDLQWLSLYGNDLTGEIPPELAKLGSASKLERLFLQDNDLSEEIPEELGSLTSLTHLLLRGNNLGGEIPHELGNLPNLKWLYLSGNTFKGCIPERLRVLELHDLDDLDISFCDFDVLAAIYDSAGGTSWQNNDNWMSDRPFSDWYGVTTDEIGRVTGLDLRSNELSGEIPTELGSLYKLESLALQLNELTGVIPTELGSLVNLSRLVLHTNGFTGEIPEELGGLSNLSLLRLDENMLTGEIPSELGNLSNLTDMELWENRLSGAIPTELGNLSNLRVLTLWGNQLTGEIPVELGSLSYLRWLWLHDNQLSGGIPAELGSLLNLDSLLLNSNQLTRGIPPELGHIGYLSTLDLSQNRLTGTIPVELGDYHYLRELNLSQNELSGEIPVEISNNYYLRLLDLSENELTGEIPAGLSTLQYLQRLNLSGNQLTGCIPAALRSVVENDFHDLRLPYCDVLVSGLTISPRSLTPPFDPYRTFYTAFEGSTRVTVAPINEHNATFQFLDQDRNEIADLNSTLDGLQVNLNTGIAAIRIVVNSQDGQATHNYVIRVASAAPGAPSIEGIAPDEDGLTVLWIPPIDTGGADIESYDLRYIQSAADETVESNWTVVEDIWTPASNDGLKYAITGLTGGIAYDVQVRAVNSVGSGPWSGTSVETPIASSVCLTGGAVTDRSNTGLVNDCEALLSGRDTLAGTGSLNWSANTPITEWDGIRLDGEYPSLEGTPIRVTRLFLQKRGLNGTITPKLANVRDLKWLYLDGNDLTGEIPPILYKLTYLERLYLNDNDLSGTIPAELEDLESLTQMFLHRNGLAGEIPASLSKLSNLEWLSLYDNELTGALPTELTYLSSLKRLYLNDNDLSSQVPAELGKMPGLTHLFLHGNDLTGTIPPELDGMTNLVWLSLYGNELTGEIPSELGGLANLERLYLHHNKLTGGVPSRLGDLNALTNLWLNDNQLSGHLPSQLDNLTNLVRWRLRNNNFTGCVPAKLAAIEDSDLDQLSIQVCTDS